MWRGAQWTDQHQWILILVMYLLGMSATIFSVVLSWRATAAEVTALRINGLTPAPQ